MSEESNNQEVAYAAVCSDCKATQDNDYVMNSMWYKQGTMPPCRYCGGVTQEMPVSHIPQFIEDTKGGRRKL